MPFMLTTFSVLNFERLMRCIDEQYLNMWYMFVTFSVLKLLTSMLVAGHPANIWLILVTLWVSSPDTSKVLSLLLEENMLLIVFTFSVCKYCRSTIVVRFCIL